jgi:hypothetical protein
MGQSRSRRKNINIPNDILARLEKSLIADNGRHEHFQRQQRERLKQKLADIARRYDQAYTDRLEVESLRTSGESRRIANGTGADSDGTKVFGLVQARTRPRCRQDLRTRE